MKKFISNQEKWLYYSLFFVLGLSLLMPLFIIHKFFIFPFIVPKIVFFRSLMILSLAAYTLLLFINKQKYGWKKNWLNISVIAFLGSFLVSSFFGVDFHRSFWDNHERMLGAFTLLHYGFFYMCLAQVVKDKEDWLWLFRIFLLSGSVTMFIGLYQYFGDKQFLLNNGNLRVSSTLGNAIYFSGYGFFLFIIGMYLGIKEKFWSLKILSFLAGFIGLLGIFLGGTRGTLAGFVLSVLLIVILFAFFYKGEHKTRVRKIFQVLFALGILSFGFLWFNRHTDFVKGIPAVGRFVQLDFSSGSRSTFATRLMAWDIAVEGFKQKPLLGWGPNNFYYLFNQEYNPEFLSYGYAETWFDNAHSAVFNTLAVQGLPGIVFYFALFFLPAWVLLKAYKEGRIDFFIFTFSLAFLVGHFVHNIAVFENPTSYLYFFFFLAFIKVSSEKKEGDEIYEGEAPAISTSTLAGVALSAFLVIWIFNIGVMRANMGTFQMLTAMQLGEVEQEDFERILKLPSPHKDDIRNDLARMSISSSNRSMKYFGKDYTLSQLDYFRKELEKNVLLHPMDVRVMMLQQELEKVSIQLQPNQETLFRLENLVDEALKYSPDRQQLLYAASFIKLNLNKASEAEELLLKAKNGNPKVFDSHRHLIDFYAYLGLQDKVFEAIDRAYAEVANISEAQKSALENYRVKVMETE